MAGPVINTYDSPPSPPNMGVTRRWVFKHTGRCWDYIWDGSHMWRQHVGGPSCNGARGEVDDEVSGSYRTPAGVSTDLDYVEVLSETDPHLTIPEGL